MDPADPHNLHDTADHPVIERIEIGIDGTHDEASAQKMRETLTAIAGVTDVRVDLEAELVFVSFDARKTHAPALHDAMLQAGYRPAPFAD